MTKLQRTTFKHSRAAQYVDARQLQAMTGQPKRKFAAVVVKELMDNALDACETAGVPPEVGLVVASTTETDSFDKITVTDNGLGIPPETVRGALDFNVLVSDKAAYRSPTRGAQGNALKTVFGIPPALGSLEPVVIEARGVMHEVRVWKDPAGELLVQCDDTDTPARPGTSITVSVPAQGQEGFDPEGWARAFALLNPHASVKIREFLTDATMVNRGWRISQILTVPPATPPRSTSPPIRRARIGTTGRHSNALSIPTSGMLGMVARTSSCGFSSANLRVSRPPRRRRSSASTCRTSRRSQTLGTPPARRLPGCLA